MFRTIFKHAQAGLVAAAIMGLGLGAGVASAQDLAGPTTTTFSFGSTAPIANPYTDVASGFTYTYSGGTFGSDSGGGDGGTSGIFGLDQGANETIRIDYSGDNFDFVSFWYDNQGGSVNLTVTGRNASDTVVATQTFTGVGTNTTHTLTDAGFNSVDHVIIQATTGTGFNSGVLDTFSFDAPSAADTDAPVVQSIAPTGSPAANAASMQFRVTFDESAENVSTDDFALTTTGTASGTIASVSASSGTTIDVTVNSITGTGTLRLDLSGATDIADAAANTPPAAFNSGTAHTVDRDAPSGYSVSFDQDPVNAGNDNAVSFTFAGAEVGAGYAYVITSSGGAGSVSSGGVIATATDQITGLDVTGLPDGTLTLSVTLTDAASNTGSAASDTTTKDASAPSGYSVSFDQVDINAGSANAASFTFAGAEVGATYNYTITSSGGAGSVSNSGVIATATDQITGINVSGLPDGTLTLSVTLTDTNGNTGSAATDTLTKDVAAPSGYSVTLDQDPVNFGNRDSISFTFAGAEVGATYIYSITSSGGAATVTSSGLISTATDQITGIDVRGLTDGTLTLSVTLTDGALNTGLAATDTATKEIVAPSGYSVSIDQASLTAANDDAVSFTFAGAETGATYNYTITSSGGAGSVSNSGVIATATDQITGIDVTGLPDGTLTLSVTLTDINGNVGSAATDTVAKDAMAPSGYSVTLDQDPVNAGNDDAVSYTFAGAEVGTTYNYTITSSGGAGSVSNSGVIATATDQITSIDVTGLPDGTLTLSVTLTDGASNVGSAATDTATKDTLTPSGYSASFDQASVTAANDDAVSFTFAGAETGTTYNYTITSSGGAGSVSNSGLISTATDQITGIDVTGLPDGTLTLSVTLTDGGGNTGSAATDTVAKDALAPSGYSVSFDQSAINAGNDDAVSFTFAGAEVGTTYNYTITSSGGAGAVSNTDVIATATDQITGIDVTGLPDGTLTLSVTLTDGGGNTGSAATDTIAKDVSVPSGYSVSLDQASINSGNQGAVSFTFAGAEVGTTYNYTITSSGGAGSVTNSGLISTATDQITGIDVSGLPDGTLTLSVTLTDGTGNVGAAATDTVAKESSPPSVTSITVSGTPAGNVASVDFVVAFSESASNVSTDDFALTRTGSAVGTIASVSAASGSSITVTVNAISGEGSIRLDLNGATDIADANGNAGPAAFTSGAVHTVDTTAPGAFSVSWSPSTLLFPADHASAGFAFSGAEVGTSFVVQVEDSTNATVSASGTISSANQSGTINVSTLADGALTLTATLEDAGTNTTTDNGAGTTSATKLSTVTDVSVAFQDATVTEGEQAFLTFTFDNSAVPVAVTSGAMTTTLPAGLVVATPQNLVVSCPAGTVLAVAGSSSITISGLQVASNSSCTVRVGVSSNAADTYLTTTGNFTSNLGNSGSASATLTVTQPSVSIADSSVTEGDAGTQTMQFNVSLSEPAGRTITVDYATASGTALAGADFTQANGTLTFNTGETQKTIDVTIINDTVAENDETFTVDLSNPTGMTLADGQATGQILSDDVDTVAPEIASITRSNPTAERTNADTLVWAVEFTEPVSGLTESSVDIMLNGNFVTGHTRTITGSGSSYLITASGGDLVSGNGNVELAIAAGLVIDSFGNLYLNNGVLGAREGYVLDNVAPTVSLDGVVNPGNSNQGLVTATFSEDVSGLTAAGVDVANGVLVSVTPVSARVYTLIVEPDVGSATVTVSANATSDVAGNANTASASFLMVTDLAEPKLLTVSRQIPTDEVTNADTLTWAVEFNEDVTGVDVSDFAPSASSASVTNVTGAGASYSVTVSGGDLAGFDGTIGLDAQAGGIADLTGNLFAGDFVMVAASGDNESYTLDNTAPTLVISGEINPADASQGIVTFTFSEAVTGFDANAITVADGQQISFSAVSSTVYRAVIAPDAGTALVGLADGLVFDQAGNAAVVPETYTLVVDAVAPGVTIEVPGSEVEGPFSVTFRFTEAVTGFEVGDIALTNAQASEFTKISDTEFSAVVTAETVGEIVISVAAGALTDLAGNDNEAASVSVQAIAGEIEVSFEIDDTVTKVTDISGEVDITNPGTQPIPYQVLVDVPWIGVSPAVGTIPSLGTTQLTIAVRDEADDLDPGTYVGTIQVVVDQPAGTASTGGLRRAALDNGALIVEIPLTIVIEERFGTIEIVSTVPATTLRAQQFDLTSSDEDFDGLSLTPQAGRASTGAIEKLFGTYDVTQSIPAGWRIDSISCSGDTDGGSVTDTGSGRLDIDLDPGEAIVCTVENVRDEDLIRLATQRAIRNFMIRRADRIVEAAPDLSERLSARDQSGAGTFSANVDGGRYNMAFKASLAGARNQAEARNQGAPGVPSHMRDDSGLDVWFSAEMAGVTDNRADERAKSDFGVAQLGVDWAINDDLLIGLLAQYDWMDEHADEVFEQAGAIAGAEVSGEGWMAGPYVVWRLADSLVFDGLAMYGTSDNQVNPLGYYEDDFETDRYLLQANLTGEFTSGNWALRPQATLSHYEDEQQAYTDSLGILIPGQTVTLGRLAAGPEVVWKRDRVSGGFWQVSSRVRAVWDYNPAELLTETGAFSGGDSNLTADGELGFGARFNNGAELEFQLRMSGIGDGDFEANSARINLRMPLSLMH